VGDGFDPGQQADKEHLELLDGRVFEDFLLNLHMLLQGLEESNLTEMQT
jgi:hypothetical protein